MSEESDAYRWLGECPSCAGPATQTKRYPHALCATCTGRATDLSGRPVAMSNVSLSGGFIARHRDDETVCDQVTTDHRVLIDGLEFRAGEARFGGIVVRPTE